MRSPSQRLADSIRTDNLWLSVLKALERPAYAYDLTRRLGANMITVYAVLYKLEVGGYIRRTFKGKGNGPERKYFVITRKGRAELASGERILSEALKKLTKGRSYSRA